MWDWPPFPDTRTFILRGARVPASVVAPSLLKTFGGNAVDGDGCVATDVRIVSGAIAELRPDLVADVPVIDLDGGQVWPSPVELHTHLDKGHTITRATNADNTFVGAVAAVRDDRAAFWSEDDVARRFEFSLRCAFAHGTAAIRTHIDTYQPQAAISWPVFERMRSEWAGRIELQGVALTTLDEWEGDAGRKLADLVARAGGLLGGVTRLAGAPAAQTREAIAAALDTLFRLASERGLDVDLHVDETADLEPNTLEEVALAVLRNRFAGRVVCGHCCSLSQRVPEDARRTIARVKEAAIAIVALPLVNLHLQDRQADRTPRWRGVTLLQELAAASVPVVASSDNTRDPFYTYGDLDSVEVFREAVRICHLDRRAMDWLPLITRTPAEIMALDGRGSLSIGASADLLLFRARTVSELLARPQSDRLVLRAGRAIDQSLPDFRELDAGSGT